jgi:hypothetical protein
MAIWHISQGSNAASGIQRVDVRWAPPDSRSAPGPARHRRRKGLGWHERVAVPGRFRDARGLDGALPRVSFIRQTVGVRQARPR